MLLGVLNKCIKQMGISAYIQRVLVMKFACTVPVPAKIPDVW